MPAPIESDDPLPPGTIRLSDAFEKYCLAATDRLALVERYEAALRGLGKAGKAKWKAAQSEWTAAGNAYDKAQRAAELSFRSLLANDDAPRACIRDPETGDVLELDYRKWVGCENFGVPGFTTDFVCPDDLVQPGPNGFASGKLRPVFFERKAFDIFLAAITYSGHSTKTGPGRPTDMPTIEAELDRWIAGGTVKLKQVVAQLDGPGAPSKSKIARALYKFHGQPQPNSKSIESALRDKLGNALKLM